MHFNDAYLEEISSQLPALQLLINLGWHYLPLDGMLALRDGNRNEMRSGHDSGVPAQLLRYRDAPAYYGIVRETLATYGLNDEAIADVAIRQEAVIEQHRVTDWARNHDVQREMRRGLDDLFYTVEEQTGALIEAEQLNQMIDQVIEVAKARSNGRDNEAG